jgi:hypothetical protein
MRLSNRRLNTDGLKNASELLGWIRVDLQQLSGGGREFIVRLSPENLQRARGKPMQRRQLKAQKNTEQKGKCA